MDPLVMDRGDTGFCSGGDEDEGFYSHTDASDDSADVKAPGISLSRNKRKCSEPRRLDTDLPAKKRKIDLIDSKTSPFRPWSGSPSPPAPQTRIPSKLIPWLSAQRAHVDEKAPFPLPVPNLIQPPQSRLLVQQDEPLSLVSKKKPELLRMPIVRTPSESTLKTDSFEERAPRAATESPRSKTSQQSAAASLQQQQQRNYKNMTRERRIEANARERTRVHTISAAFDTLRTSIPAYSHNQKLSKLSVLRIACSYIVTLSRLAGEDYSVDQSEPSVSECVSGVSRTIQTEGKIRKKKDD